MTILDNLSWMGIQGKARPFLITLPAVMPLLVTVLDGKLGIYRATPLPTKKSNTK
jgi:hypothetical protein